MQEARLPTASQSSQRNPTSIAEIAERVVVMCTSALFSGLSAQECMEIASCATVRDFARDELLFFQGQQSLQLVMIQSGCVKVTQLSSSGDEVILRIDGSGDAVAMPGNSRSGNHTCSASAMEQCHALAWEYTKLQALLDEFPKIRVNMSRILSGRLDELQERFREVATEKVAQRLALGLLRLVKQVGTPVAQGTRVCTSREELAQLTGTTLFTVSRLISKWAQDGFVLPGREEVVVLNTQGLKQVGEEAT